MTCHEAAVEIVQDEFRGPASATIVMADGRRYVVENAREWPVCPLLVGRYAADGELLERIQADQVQGEVETIRWAVDQLGGVYIV